MQPSWGTHSLTYICFLFGIFLTFGFFLMSSLALALTEQSSGWVYLAITICTLFFTKVAIFNALIIEPGISNENKGVKIQSRILFMLIGIWSVVIPYIEVVAFTGWIKKSTWTVTLMILSIF